MSNLSGWLRTPAGIIVSLLGLLTTVAGGIAFFRAQPRLGLLLTLAVAILALIATLLYFVFAKQQDLIGAPVPRYSARTRGWCASGAVLIALACGLLLLYPNVASWIVRTVVGPEEMADPKGNSQHAPPHESPVAVAVSKPVEDRGRRRIVIGDFLGSAIAPINVQQRLYDDITARLKEKQILGVKVILDAETIHTPETAQETAQRHDAAAVIWGYTDKQGVVFRVLLQEPHSRLAAVSAEQAPWVMTPMEKQIGSQSKDAIKQAAFITMYVAGQLLYLDNRYAEGAKAFDEAMRLAKGLKLDNAALMPFFAARSAQMALPPPVHDAPNAEEPFATIACGYARALKLQPRLYQAYANLGILLAPRRDSQGTYEELPGKVRDCFAEAHLDTSGQPEWMFQQAKHLRRDLTAIAYNSLATEWSGMMDPYPFEDYLDRFEKRVQALLVQDDTLTGAHLMLGVLAFRRGDAAAARKQFERVVQLDPQFAGARTDLGQALWVLGETEHAEAEFRAALEAQRADLIAATSFAALAIRRGDVAAARSVVFSLTEGKQPVDPSLEALWLLRAWLNVLAGEHHEALSVLLPMKKESETISESGPTITFDLLRVMIALIREASGDTARAEKEFGGGIMNPVPRKWKPQWGINEVLSSGWEAIGSRCGRPDPTTLAQVRNRCLASGTAVAQLSEIFRTVTEQAKYNIGHQYFVYPGLRCPYLYVPGDGRWQFVSAILIGHDGVGNKGKDRRALPLPFGGELRIAERELETTYLTSARVEYERPGGFVEEHDVIEKHLWRRELVLQRGDEVLLHFPPAPADTIRAWIVASGYYVRHGGHQVARP